MTVRIYRSTDASAPVLTGQVGKLTDLLDAVLVNGYGSQTAAGWTISQTTTNKRGFLQNLTGANNASGVLLYVDDTGPGAGAAKEARACGFETMSAITPTGTGQFPTNGQTSSIGTGQVCIRKSATADATARAWTCIANGQTIYLAIETGDIATPVTAYPFVFGDFFSYKTSDSYAQIIVGRTIENSATCANDQLAGLYPSASSGSPGTVTQDLTTPIGGHFVCRSWTTVGGAVQVGKQMDISKFGQAFTAVAGGQTSQRGGYAQSGAAGLAGATFAPGRNSIPAAFPYPNGPDGACWLSPLQIYHNGSIRGYFKGLWGPMHDRPLNHADTYTIAGGNLTGKSMIALNCAAWIASANDQAQFHIETSDTWA